MSSRRPIALTSRRSCSWWCILFEATGTANATVTVTNSIFDDLRADGINAGVGDTATLRFTVSTGSFTDNGFAAIRMGQSQTGTAIYKIDGVSTITGHATTAMVEHYGKGVDQKRLALSAIAKLERSEDAK